MNNLPAETLSPPGEKAENLHPGGMSECLCKRSELFVDLVAFDRS